MTKSREWGFTRFNALGKATTFPILIDSEHAFWKQQTKIHCCYAWKAITYLKVSHTPNRIKCLHNTLSRDLYRVLTIAQSGQTHYLISFIVNLSESSTLLCSLKPIWMRNRNISQLKSKHGLKGNFAFLVMPIVNNEKCRKINHSCDSDNTIVEPSELMGWTKQF